MSDAAKEYAPIRVRIRLASGDVVVRDVAAQYTALGGKVAA